MSPAPRPSKRSSSGRCSSALSRPVAASAPVLGGTQDREAPATRTRPPGAGAPPRDRARAASAARGPRPAPRGDRGHRGRGRSGSRVRRARSRACPDGRCARDLRPGRSPGKRRGDPGRDRQAAAARGNGEVVRRRRVGATRSPSHLEAAAAGVPRPPTGPRRSPRPIGGELVYVGEDRFGQQREGLGDRARRRGRGGDPPPGHTCSDPVRGLQRVECASLALLAPAELDVDLAAGSRPASGSLIRPTNWPRRFADPAGRRARSALQRTRVLGDLAGDRLEDLRRDRVQLGLDQVSDLGGSPRQGSESKAFVI